MQVLINAKIECFLKNKDTFYFVLQILFVSLQYRKGDKRSDHLPQIPLLLPSWLNV